MAEFAPGAEGWLSVAEGFLAALGHVLMGFAEANRAECLRLIVGIGPKGMGGRGCRLLVRVWVGRGGLCTITCAGDAGPLAPYLTRWVSVGVLGDSRQNGHGLGAWRHFL